MPHPHPRQTTVTLQTHWNRACQACLQFQLCPNVHCFDICAPFATCWSARSFPSTPLEHLGHYMHSINIFHDKAVGTKPRVFPPEKMAPRIYPPPPMSFPTLGKTVPDHPLGAGCQVTPPPPPGNDKGWGTTRGGGGTSGTTFRDGVRNSRVM